MEANCQMDERKKKENSAIQWVWPGKDNSEYRMYLPGTASEGKLTNI